MFKTTMLAIVAVLALQTQDSLANHIVTEEQAIAAFQALKARVDDLQAQIDDHHPPVKVVFVTSLRFNGNLGGLTGADVECQDLADGPASIVPPGTYLAWLSDSTLVAPINRFTQSSVPYVRPDGSLVATDFTDLTDGNLLTPINMDETGVRQIEDVITWTFTDTQGAAGSDNEQQSCLDWQSTGGSPLFGSAGNDNVITFRWTEQSFGIVPCDFPARLYCFQQ